MPYPLPDEIDPPQTSVCVPVPEDDNHKRAFLGQLAELARYWTWDKDPTKTKARDSAAVWATIYDTVFDRLINGETCGTGGGAVADDIYDLLSNIMRGVADLKNEQRAKVYYDGSTTTSINTSAPTYTFASAGDSQTPEEAILRQTGLCLAVRRYTNQIMHDAYNLAAGISGISGGAAAVAFLLGGPIGFVVGAVVLALAGFVAADILAALEDSDAMDEVVCEMYTRLSGRAINQANFISGVNAMTVSAGNAAIIAQLIKENSDQLANYLFFVDCLGNGYDAAQAGAEGDCCVPDWGCEGWFDLRVGIPPYVSLITGTWVEGVGVLCSTVEGSVKVARIHITLPEPCTLPGDYLKNRFNAVVVSQVNESIHLELWGGGVQCVGGEINGISGWSNAGEFTSPCFSTTGTIEAMRIYKRIPGGATVLGHPLVGFWWSTDNVDEPFPFT